LNCYARFLTQKEKISVKKVMRIVGDQREGKVERRYGEKNGRQGEGSGEKGWWEERAKCGEKKIVGKGRGVERKNCGKKRM
jgi:hypothetical protein